MAVARKTKAPVASRGQKEVKQSKFTTAAPSHELTERELATHLTDLGNAARFVRHHRRRLIFVSGLGWLLYDGTRWRPAGADLTRLAKETVSLIYQELNTCPASQRKELARWAGESENRQRISAMLSLAECELEIDADALDADPMLLNVLNGTLDLTLAPRTKRLRPHSPTDYITKLAPVVYDPAAKSKLFSRVLIHAQPIDDARDFFKKCAGYSLTGNTGEDVFLLLHGVTRTSKGTLQEAIACMLGDYAITCELDMLAKRDRSGGPRPELVRLRGARMVSIYETSRSMALSASLVKTLSGSDPITCRDMYKGPVTFRPQCKIWVATNHRPNAPEDDDALWERIREIPFTAQLSEKERDRKVRSDLRKPEHGAAVLAWAVEGCLQWQRDGLKQPDVIRAAGLSYRRDMDPFNRFLDECCRLDPRKWTSIADLHEAYATWCEEEGHIEQRGGALSRKLRALGCEPQTKNKEGGRGLTGISLGAVFAVSKPTAGKVLDKKARFR